MKNTLRFLGAVIGAGLLFAAPGTAAGQEAGAPAVRYDSSAVRARTPAADPLLVYRNDADFLYDREPPASLGLWDRFWRWVRETILDPLNRVTPGWVGDWFVYLLAAAGVAFAVVRLLRMDLGGVFTPNPSAAGVAFEPVDERLEGVDFDALVEEAVAARAYRRAVRLLYLKTLRVLAARHLIDWQPDKTNHEYVRELRRPALRGPFAALTTLFEYVWYGDFEVDEAVFGRIRPSFARFEQRVHEEAS